MELARKRYVNREKNFLSHGFDVIWIIAVCVKASSNPRIFTRSKKKKNPQKLSIFSIRFASCEKRPNVWILGATWQFFYERTSKALSFSII